MTFIFETREGTIKALFIKLKVCSINCYHPKMIALHSACFSMFITGIMVLLQTCAKACIHSKFLVSETAPTVPKMYRIYWYYRKIIVLKHGCSFLTLTGVMILGSKKNLVHDVTVTIGIKLCSWNIIALIDIVQR